MSTINRSVWQDKAGIPGVIREGPIPSGMRDNEIQVKAHAWGLNPADHMIQDIPLSFVRYPLILGEDVGGTVERVGSAVDKFKKGDRVGAVALGAASLRPEEGCFQDYVVHDQILAMKIPDSMSFAEAAVLPLCVATSGHGLYSKDFLGLPFPQVEPNSTGKSLLVWGGASNVGSNGIQLAKFSGFDVITTCSPRNFDYVKSLGASKAFDYNSPSAIENIAAELDKGTCAGILNAAGPTKPACEVSAKSKQKLFVASTSPVFEGDAPEGVDAKMIYAEGGGNIYGYSSQATFQGFLPEALAKGVYKVAPFPEVIKTKGVEGIQEGMDYLKKGVSAKKIIVEQK